MAVAARIVVIEPDAPGTGAGSGVEGALTAWMQAGEAPVTLVVRAGPAPGPARDRVMESLGEFLARAALEGCRPDPAALALPAAVDRPAEMALEAATAFRGRPAIHLLLPATGLEAIQRGGRISLEDGFDACARRWWEGLLGLAAAAPSVSLVPEVAGAGLSPLATRGTWAGPTPGLAELVPPASRRLRLDLDFGELLESADDAPGALARVAAAVVEEADQRLGAGTGPRRLALNLVGIGQALVRRGPAPGRFDALTWLAARLRAFLAGARAASVALARRLGPAAGVEPFPVPRSLEVADTGVLDRAVLTHGARHSHLVCISPWSLAEPELGRAGIGLLPALKWADSVAWRRPAGTPPVAYGEALRFAWAVARGA